MQKQKLANAVAKTETLQGACKEDQHIKAGLVAQLSDGALTCSLICMLFVAEDFADSQAFVQPSSRQTSCKGPWRCAGRSSRSCALRWPLSARV